MERIPYDKVLEIQKSVNIVDIISEYLPVEQKGKNYFAICPFHDDHNPSLSISPEKQIYTCFVCGASGNVFNFIMNYEKISFVDAVLKVADKAGISLDYKKVQYKKENKFDKYYKIFDIASKYYQNNLMSTYGKSATTYLNNRKINSDTIKKFEIGLSLNDNSLSKLLINKGYLKEDLINIGLIGSTKTENYDIFRNRIMFPLYDNDGNTVGFSGRIYNDEKENKYVNSKESVVFKKGSLLYNYHNAINYSRESKEIIIVEGFMDVIRLSTIGINNVVASMGTAITIDHANLLKKLSKNVILCFDGDSAGEKATISAINELEKVGIKPKIIRLEEDLDPDDYIVKKGEEAFLNKLKNPLTTLEFNMNVKKNKTDFNDYNAVSAYIHALIPELENIRDKIVYELTIKRISKETGVDKETINDLIKKERLESKKDFIIKKPEINIGDKYKKAEMYLVYYMLKDTYVIEEYTKNVSYIRNKTLSKLAIKILDFYDKNKYINISDFITFLQDDEELINEALKLDMLDLPPLNKKSIIEYINTIDEGILKSKIDELKEKLKKETDTNKKVEILNKIAQLKKKE